ncbi:peptidase inhibitor family I36 protein [Embleya sp. NBC_00896]|uniref:peptidase inhibitor family I36 protein n=1 Tax=Embleya sp. NBC_00896 TaxID=2975961 RepID=UPI002F90950D|nr:peptidase inhibitor family I36 protein [Embleya sp. NBC_00896]
MRFRFAATLACLTMTIALTGGGAGARASTDREEALDAPRQKIESTGVLALHCQRGYFCAYIHANYSGELLKSQAGRGSRVDVGGGTSSGSNNTANEWVGVNDLCCGVPDDDVFKWAPYTEANVNSSANDKINYFRVR